MALAWGTPRSVEAPAMCVCRQSPGRPVPHNGLRFGFCMRGIEAPGHDRATEYHEGCRVHGHSP